MEVVINVHPLQMSSRSSSKSKNTLSLASLLLRENDKKCSLCMCECVTEVAIKLMDRF